MMPSLLVYINIFFHLQPNSILPFPPIHPAAITASSKLPSYQYCNAHYSPALVSLHSEPLRCLYFLSWAPSNSPFTSSLTYGSLLLPWWPCNIFPAPVILLQCCIMHMHSRCPCLHRLDELAHADAPMPRQYDKGLSSLICSMVLFVLWYILQLPVLKPKQSKSLGT